MNKYRCRSCGVHASRIRPCERCGRMTCYKCTIEAKCPDCWTEVQARAFAMKDVAYFDDLERRLRCVN